MTYYLFKDVELKGTRMNPKFINTIHRSQPSSIVSYNNQFSTNVEIKIIILASAERCLYYVNNFSLRCVFNVDPKYPGPGKPGQRSDPALAVPSGTSGRLHQPGNHLLGGNFRNLYFHIEYSCFVSYFIYLSVFGCYRPCCPINVIYLEKKL